jgi:hypothetical protein
MSISFVNQREANVTGIIIRQFPVLTITYEASARLGVWLEKNISTEQHHE